MFGWIGITSKMPSGCVLEVGLKGIIISEYVSGQQWWFSVETEGENYFTAKPFLFYQDSSDLHDSSDFVDDDLHLRQKSVVSPQCGDVIVNLVMGEVGESKRAVGADVETGGIKSLNYATAEHLAGVWLKKKWTPCSLQYSSTNGVFKNCSTTIEQ